MTTRALAAWLVLSAGGWPGALLAGADADDYAEPLRRAPPQLSLTSSQEQAVGIRVEQPLALRSAPQIEAYGTVLDPVALANDMGRVETTRVAAAAAEAEATRLEHLYRDDAQVSLKASQAAQAQSAEASAQARAAALGFSLQWGPLASWSAGQRRALLEALTHGGQVLVRADVPAHPLGSTVDRHAVVVIDGVNVSARVLGPLPRTDGPAQTAGWLLQLERTPGALGPGARIEVRLQAAATAGLLGARLDVFPDFAPPHVLVQVEAPGLDATQVESLVTRPLEDVLGGAEDVEAVRSTSSQGLAAIQVVFGRGSDPYLQRQVISERLGGGSALLPPGIGPPQLSPLSSSMEYLLHFGFTSDRLSPLELHDLVRWTLKPQILAVPGVAQAQIFGGESRERQLWVDPVKLNAAGVTLEELSEAAGRATLISGGG